MRRNTPLQSNRLSPKHNFLFVSDLHLAEGTDPQTGKIAPLEDFFFDDAFANMLVYHVELSEDAAISAAFRKPWKLYINGDFFEFLQVVSVPDETSSDVVNGKIKVTDHLKTYGLGTSEPETVWKLMRIAGGHPAFFQALGWFLAHPENELVIMRGNHDVELVWKDVQKSVCNTIAASYFAWYRDMVDGRIPESSLPFKDSLPASMPEDFTSRIHFPEWFDYEEDLFYVEHGNQYDPVNAFSSIDRPFLEKDSKLIELPSGSFFVRYFFNKVEQIHPFADNIRPLSAYVHYALSKKPADTFYMLMKQPLVSLNAVLNLLKKSNKMRPDMSAEEDIVTRLPLPNDKVRLIEQIRERASKLSRKRNGRYLRGVVTGATLGGIFWILVLIALRNFFVGQVGSLLISLLFIGTIYVMRLRLTRYLNDTASWVTLPEVADAINYVLNRKAQGESNAVQFLIFGHDHNPKYEELSQHQNGRSYRQWYVNTGSWLPSYDESKRVIRSAVQLPFLRIVPDRVGFDSSLPELLEWHDAERRPYPIRLFEGDVE
ncbi:MAG: hypothetical protein AAF902_10925 [Chloroflexota bacterium]